MSLRVAVLGWLLVAVLVALSVFFFFGGLLILIVGISGLIKGEGLSALYEVLVGASLLWVFIKQAFVRLRRRASRGEMVASIGSIPDEGAPSAH